MMFYYTSGHIFPSEDSKGKSMTKAYQSKSKPIAVPIAVLPSVQLPSYGWDVAFQLSAA